MPKRDVAVAIDDEFLPAVDEAWVADWVTRTLDGEGVAEDTEVSVLVTDDALVQELNREFRGEDEPTDVLSFGLSELGPVAAGETAFVQPPDNILHLGEIIISYPYASREAEKQEHPVDWEVAHLLVHGVLHLLGYDHLEPEDEQEMRAREHAVLGVHY